MCVCVFLRVCVCVCVHIYVCMYARMHACMHACMHVCILYVCTYGQVRALGAHMQAMVHLFESKLDQERRDSSLLAARYIHIYMDGWMDVFILDMDV